MPDLNSTSRKPDILIIDDDATIRLLMKEALTEDIYTINEAADGLAGLDQIKKHQPDLVLLDVNMPGINGFDVCTKIRELYGDNNISIVMVTALEDPKSIEKSYEVGATDFISKPINWDTFPYRIQYLIKARHAIIELNNNKSHLEYMEHISRIITQNKNKDTIIQETLSAILEIFSADRAILIKPDSTHDNSFIVECETTNTIMEAIKDITILDCLNDKTLKLVTHSEYPLISRYDSNHPAPASNKTLKQQMLSSLYLRHAGSWFLIIQQNTVQADWTNTDEETFYKISLRLTNMLSRHLLTDKLRRSKDLLKQAQKIGHLGNWNWNTSTNNLAWSDEVYRIYGYQDDTHSPDISEYFRIEFEEDDERLNLFKNMQDKTNGSYQMDHRIRIQKNNIRWLHEECIGTYDNSGKLLEVNGIVQDITDAHNKKEQEVHDNKMEAIGQLTSGIAHDFGNLMTVAKGNMELLEEYMSKQYDIGSEAAELLEDARSAVNDSVELTKQLLAFSRKKSIAPIYVNVNETIKKIKNLLKYTLGGRITMSINVDKGLPDILVDPAQFESSLLNIIINARDAMHNGGEIHIHAEIMTIEDSQKIILNTDNDIGSKCVSIYIKDNGIGMDNDVLEHAIEPFYTTGKPNGTGLGLSMVYGFIKQSGGELIIHSQLEKGSTIYLQFPIYDGKAVKPSKKDTIELLSDVDATILIVEDQHKVRQYAVRCLKKTGFTILEAKDASTARDLLKSNHVDLLFTDILMPGDMNGNELADWVSQEYPGIKILLTTAMDKSTIKKEDCIKQKVKKHDFKLLPKPYSQIELCENISGILKSDNT